MNGSRQIDINTFYTLLDKVQEKFPKQSLSKITSTTLPKQGVYFFFENGEQRDNKKDCRVVRIGTHAAIANSNATLYDRLCQHRGFYSMAGNHRSSVFRKLIGISLLHRDLLKFQYWGDKTKKGDKIIKESEKPLEVKVSEYLHSMFFTVLEVPGFASKDNDRALIEENSIALLSNYNKAPIDKKSVSWLGLYSKDEKVIESGLWNSKHVNQSYIDERFFETFEYHLLKMKIY